MSVIGVMVVAVVINIMTTYYGKNYYLYTSIAHLLFLALLGGIGCCYRGFLSFILLYDRYLTFLIEFIPKQWIPVHWLYVVRSTSSNEGGGFIRGFVMTIITLSYLSFYQVEYIISPNLFVIGLLGLLIYKLGNLAL